jgi:hypothetical protein
MAGLVEEFLMVSAGIPGDLPVHPEPLDVRRELDRIVVGFHDRPSRWTASSA